MIVESALPDRHRAKRHGFAHGLGIADIVPCRRIVGMHAAGVKHERGMPGGNGPGPRGRGR